ncbi:hypothetical protein SRHO_G00179160 [Serrasalmus rhombeus]
MIPKLLQRLYTFSTHPLSRTLTLKLRTTRTQLFSPQPGPLMMCTTHLQLLSPALLMTRTQLWNLGQALLSTTL